MEQRSSSGNKSVIWPRHRERRTKLLKTDNPALSFGFRISKFMLRDAAKHKLPPPPFPSSFHVLTSLCRHRTSQIKPRAFEDAKLVKAQSAFHEAKEKRRALKTKRRSRKQKKIKEAKKEKDLGSFRFPDLPQEIIDMVFEHAFTISSGRKPKLLWALKGNKLFDSAQVVWLRTNMFNVCLMRNMVKGGVPKVGKEGVQPMALMNLPKIRRLRIVVP